MRRLALISLPILVFLFIIGCASADAPRMVTASFASPSAKESSTLHLELASSQAERSLGLMYRKEMPSDRGMIFIYPAPGIRIFWMKNTYLSLDLIFLDKHRKVQGIVAAAKPLSTERIRLPEDTASQYVVEVNAGIAAALNIRAGDTLIVNTPLPKGEEGI